MPTTGLAGTIHQRRRFVGGAAMTLAAAELGFLGSATPVSASSTGGPAPDQTWHEHLVRRVEADRRRRPECRLRRGRPADGPAVILLHGWPYDIHSYVDVAPMLASAGYRVIVPYLRGYGTTRFLSDETLRNGQPSAVALDIIALMDALKIQKAILGGFDWGGADRRHHRGVLARALQGPGLGERLSDRQPGGRQDPLPPRLSCSGGTSIISPPTAAGPATKIPARLRQADLADRFAEMGVR